MRKAIPAFVILVAVLSGLLYWQLRAQRLATEGPAGGSATIEGVEVDVVARLPARVTEILVETGAEVAAGQRLIELDCAEPRALLAQAEAGVAAAQAGIESAEDQVRLAAEGVAVARGQVQAARAAARASAAQAEAAQVERDAAQRASSRLAEVHKAGAATEQNLDSVRSQAQARSRQVEALRAAAEAAEAQGGVAEDGRETARIREELAARGVKAARAQLAAAEAARARAALSTGECTLRAPRAGIVSSRNFEPGEVVMPGSRLLTLVDIREVRATFYLPNAELAAARPGQGVEVVADAWPGQRFAGRVLRVGSQAEFTPRNVQTREDRDRLVYAVEVALPNPDRRLRPGMPVEVILPGTAKGQAR
jgi:HlyD family secretion protein